MHRINLKTLLGWTLVLLATSSLAFAFQTEPSITIDPAEGGTGVNFTVDVSGAPAETDLTFEFVYEPTGEVVFTTTRTTDAGGAARLVVVSEASDPLGAYLVRVYEGTGVNALSDVLAEGRFAITDDAAEPQPEAEPQQEDTSNDIALTIVPATAEQGEVFTVTVNRLPANQAISLRVIYEGDGEEVYRRTWVANDNGQVRVELFTEPGDEAGTYRVEVLDRTSDELLAAGSFEVASPFGEDASVSVSPESGMSGDEFTLSISGLRPFLTVDVEIVGQASGRRLLRDSLRMDAEGEATLSFVADDDIPFDTYLVTISGGGGEISAEGFVIGTGNPDDTPRLVFDPAISVSPAEGPRGTRHTLRATGLEPDTVYGIGITDTETGFSAFFSSERSNALGEIALNVTSTLGDEPGAYVVEVARSGETLAATALTITSGLADSLRAEIDIEPTSGPVGTLHRFTINNLAPGETYAVTVEQAFVAIYDESMTANDEGVIRFNFISRADSFPGAYTVRVAQDELVFGTASLTVEGEDTGVDVAVIPGEGIPGTLQTISVGGLEAGQRVAVNVTRDDELVFTNTFAANDDGGFSFSIVSRAEFGPGVYTVSVTEAAEPVPEDAPLPQLDPEVRADLATLAETTLYIGPDINIAVAPPEGEIGTEHAITITGLEPLEVVDVAVLIGRRVVEQRTYQVNLQGEVNASFTSEEAMIEGQYRVEVIYGDGVAVSEPLFVGVPASPFAEASVSIAPEAGPIGTTHTVTVTDLPPGAAATVTLSLGDEIAFERDITADDDGEARFNIVSTEANQPGDYTLTLSRTADEGDDILAQTSLLVQERQLNPVVTIEPQSGPQGTVHTVTVTDLMPGETVTLEASLDGDVVYSNEVTADANGRVETTLVSEADDEAGRYEVAILREGQLIAAADLTISATDEVAVAIVPDGGTINEDRTLTINGLEPNETARLEIRLDAEVIFSEDVTANADGVAELTVPADRFSLPGDYAVRVLREGQTLALSRFSAEDAEDAPPVAEPPAEDGEARIAIEPTSGPVGTLHNVTISDLEPGETVSVFVDLGDETVLETSATANDEGVATLQLVSEETDPLGDYSVRIVRGDRAIAEGTLTITEDVAQEPDEQEQAEQAVSVSITPNDGPIGTEYTATVSGLEAGETVTLDVTFNESSVFSTERTANDEGVITLTLFSEEGDEPGQYTLLVRRDQAVLAQTSFGIGEVDVIQEPDDQPTQDQEDTQTRTETREGTLNASNPTDSLTFEGRAGDSVVISMNAADFDSLLILQNADGEEIARDDDSGEGFNALIGPFTLPETGTYTVIITSYRYENFDEIETGAYTLEVSIVTTDDALVQEPDEQDETPDEASEAAEDATEVFTGSLDAERPEAIINFAAEAGDYVTISMSSAEFDTYLRLLNEEGEEIAFNDDSGGTLNSRMGPLVIPATGEYTIVASSFGFATSDRTETGDYTVTLLTTVPQDVVLGEAITGNVNADNPAEIYRFSGEAGDTLAISLNQNTFDAQLSLSGPQGDELRFADSARGTGALIGPYTLPESGDYTLAISQSDLGTTSFGGAFELQVAQANVMPIAYGDTLDVSLGEDASFAFYRVEASAGDLISVRANSGGDVDTLLTLTDESGFELVSDDDGGAGFDPEIDRYVVDQDGALIITLQTYTPGQTGEVELVLERNAARTLSEAPATVNLSDKQDRALLTLDVEAGEAVSLRVVVSNGQPEDLTITATLDGFELMRYRALGLRNEAVLSFTAPNDGTVRVLLEEFGVANSVIDITVLED